MVEISGSNASQHAVGQGNASTRVWTVPWAERLDFAESLLGAPHPDVPACWCNSVSIEPFPSRDPVAYPGGAIGYDLARVTAQYAIDPANQPWPIDKPQLREQTALSIQSFQSAAEFLRLPARATRWADNMPGYPSAPLPEDDSAAGRMLVSKIEIALAWDYVDQPPLADWNQRVGQVNDAEFLGCEPETLLFIGYELAASTRASIQSPWTWRLVPKFSYRAIHVDDQTYGWNHEYRADGWKRVKMADGAGGFTDRYPTGDFSDMFA